MELTIRPIRREEFPLLADFLYDAIYRSDPSSPLPRQIVEHPSLRIYIADFGTLPDDRCLVAQAEGHVVGMVWVRCIRAYGYIGEGIPEFVLSVAAPCRGQGIGTRLMREMLQRLSAAGYPEASLSVQRRNPAVRLYRRLGFRTVKRTLEEYIMVCDLRDADSAVANRTAGTLRPKQRRPAAVAAGRLSSDRKRLFIRAPCTRSPTPRSPSESRRRPPSPRRRPFPLSDRLRRP